ncbi:hypothetical protein ES702_04522 [subsurface metagenome]
MRKKYRPATSYISQDPERRQRQRANLVRGRMKHAMKAEAKAPQFNDPAYGGDIVKFGEEQFFIPETRKPIILENFQKKEILGPLFYAEKRPTMALIGQTKKSGKSTIGAMVASWFLFQGENYSEVYLAARDKDQASWIIFSKLVKAIRMNPQMLARCKITSDSVELPHKGSVLRCLPTEVSAAGLNPNLVIFDELHLYEYESMRRFWEELTTVPTRKHPLILIVTYAGYNTDEDNLLYSLYKKGLEGKDSTFFFYWSGKNLMPWQTKAYLKQQKGRLRLGTYKRLHCNEWTSGEEAFISDTAWDACVDQKLKPSLPSKEIHITTGIDIGVKSDYSSCVSVSRDNNKVRLVTYKIWKPTKKNPIDLEAVETYVEELAKGYILDNVLFDPYQFHRSGMSLKKQGIHTEEYPQTSDRLVKMGQLLYDLITQGNMELYPDEELRREALHTKAKETQRGWRLTKAGSGKIDAIIALAMACAGCIEKVRSRPGRVYIVGED